MAARRSTLHLREGLVDCVELLLAAGASVNARSTSPGGHLSTSALSNDKRRWWPLFLRAGAQIPSYPSHPYILHVGNAGGFKKYEQAHLARITAILAPTPRLPPEMVRKIVALAPRRLTAERQCVDMYTPRHYPPLTTQHGHPWGCSAAARFSASARSRTETTCAKISSVMRIVSRSSSNFDSKSFSWSGVRSPCSRFNAMARAKFAPYCWRFLRSVASSGRSGFGFGAGAQPAPGASGFFGGGCGFRRGRFRRFSQ